MLFMTSMFTGRWEVKPIFKRKNSLLWALCHGHSRQKGACTGPCFESMHPMSASRQFYFMTLDAPNQNNMRCSVLWVVVMDGLMKWTLFPGARPYHIFSEMGTGSQKHSRRNVRVWQALSIFMEYKNETRLKRKNHQKYINSLKKRFWISCVKLKQRAIFHTT